MFQDDARLTRRDPCRNANAGSGKKIDTTRRDATTPRMYVDRKISDLLAGYEPSRALFLQKVHGLFCHQRK